MPPFDLTSTQPFRDTRLGRSKFRNDVERLNRVHDGNPDAMFEEFLLSDEFGMSYLPNHDRGVISMVRNTILDTPSVGELARHYSSKKKLFNTAERARLKRIWLMLADAESVMSYARYESYDSVRMNRNLPRTVLSMLQRESISLEIDSLLWNPSFSLDWLVRENSVFCLIGPNYSVKRSILQTPCVDFELASSFISTRPDMIDDMLKNNHYISEKLLSQLIFSAATSYIDECKFSSLINQLHIVEVPLHKLSYMKICIDHDAEASLEKLTPALLDELLSISLEGVFDLSSLNQKFKKELLKESLLDDKRSDLLTAEELADFYDVETDKRMLA